jgi:glycosyltransferase involved in cell wall biosynthesis
MKVLHVHSGNLYGGVETMLVTLARHRELCVDMEPYFALCFEGRLARELAATGAPLYSLGTVRISRPHSIWRARRRLQELVRQQHFDVAMCHSTWSQAIFGQSAKSADIPIAFYLHDVARGRHWLERWAKRTSPDLVVCNSRFTSESVPALYPKTSYRVVHCAVPPPDTTFSRVDRARTRSEFATPENDVVVVQVSRLEAWKGHMQCLRALGQLRDVRRWTCWQVGRPQRPEEARYLSLLKAEAIRLRIADRVRFLGERSDISRLLSAGDVFCQPNTAPEPFGITLVEALQAGLPIVTTARGGATEIVDPSCGILVEPGDVPGLSTSLRLLIEDRGLRDRLAAGGPLRARRLSDPAAQMALLRQSLARVIRKEVAA